MYTLVLKLTYVWKVIVTTLFCCIETPPKRGGWPGGAVARLIQAWAALSLAPELFLRFRGYRAALLSPSVPRTVSRLAAVLPPELFSEEPLCSAPHDR